MSAHLDLDDVAAQSPAAQRELADLRNRLDAALMIVVDLCGEVREPELLEARALRKDAELYRILSADFSVSSHDIDGNHTWAYKRNYTLRGPTLAAAIDAAHREKT